MAGIVKTSGKIFKRALGFNIENPAVIAVIILAGAYSINALLEIPPVRTLFGWIGYYFNIIIFYINQVLPFVKNPFDAEFFYAISPWLWLRGIIISAFLTGQNITVIIERRIKEISMFVAALLAAFLYCIILSYTHSKGFSANLIQSFQNIPYAGYLDELSVACFIGLLAGREFGIYCLNRGKPKFYDNISGPKIKVRYMSEDDWNPN